MCDKLTLCDIDPGEKATVISVGGEDYMKRRLFDLGLIEGTFVECVGKSPSGDPKAYLIRGAVIALRSEDSINICVKSARRQ